MSRWHMIGLLLIILLIGSTNPAAAQGGEELCPALVENALLSLDDICGGLGRNSACYGHNRIDATFWQEQAEDFFSNPADRAPIIELQTLATTPLQLDSKLWGLALLHLQANLPETLPGQAVTFLLMGDTEITNAVAPEDVPEPVTPVEAETRSASNLRSGPSTNYNIVDSFPGGTPLTLVGVNPQQDWYELVLEDGSNAWIWANLVNVTGDGLDELPVTAGPDAGPRYGPMQAFYFTSSFSGPQCNEAPNALVIQSNEVAEVTLNVNELEFTIGSTIILTTAQVPNNPNPAMVIMLVEGQFRTNLNGIPIRLTRPGGAIAIQLNERGRVDRFSRLVRLNDQTANNMVQFACRNAGMVGLFDVPVDPSLCSTPPSYYIPPPPPTAVPPTPVPAGPSISFRADRTAINQGECATLFWDMEGIREAYLDNQGVTGHGSMQVCPRQTQTYLLNIVLPDGQTTSRSITITVGNSYSIRFWSDKTETFGPDETATIFWEVSGIREVYFEGMGVTGSGSYVVVPYSKVTVTPPQDVVYTLSVVLLDGTTVTRQVTIRANY